MNPFGLELEICCWVSPLDLSSPLTPLENQFEVLPLLPERSYGDFLPPLALQNEVPELQTFFSVELSDALPLLSTPQVIPSQGTTLVQTGSSATQPEVTVLHPQTSLESSILVQNGVSDSDKDSRSTNSDDQVEEMVGSDTEYTEDSDVITTPNSQVVPFSDEVARGVKLGTSKSPVIEAFVYCALQGWGVHIKKSTRNEVEFIVTDFDYYYACSNRICSKQRPTEDISARIKGLKRWFPDFPARKAQISGTFTVSVGKGNNKIHKIRKIMNKNRELIGIYKMRRSR